MRIATSALRAAFAAALMSAAGPAFADGEVEAADAGEGERERIFVYGWRSNYAADEISTATRTDTPLIDVPQSIAVISRDLIIDQGMRSMADVVRYAPGVSMGQGEGHRDAPTLRGNASTADFFVDGVRDDVQYFRDLYNAERIEVLRGPNAMIFGRGGGGGVINRVTRQAEGERIREITLNAGSYDHWRGAVDLSAHLGGPLAGRVNAMYENSGSYRDFVELERYGVNPTATVFLADETLFRFGLEHFNDARTVDRGVPSENGLPFAGSRSAYFGNPDASFTDATVNLADLSFEHALARGLLVRSHTLIGDYDKYYQNVHARTEVDAAGDVGLQAYFSRTERTNAFNHSDLIWETSTGPIGHTVLAGFEIGRQETDNTRAPNNNAAGVVNVASPTTFAPPVFLAPLRDDNRVDADVAALYVQDQISLGPRLEVVAGLRFDQFELAIDDRTAANADLSRTDEFVSPRLGVIFKPIDNLSLYASYSVSRLPQSGDQFSGLNAATAALEPEEFENYEIGVKWDLRPDLALTAAIYRLDRTNTTAIDPATSFTVLTGSQRSEGFELTLTGSVTDDWEIVAGYAYQDAEITSDTSSAPAGSVIALVPEHAVSAWNHWRFTDQWGAGLGVVHQSDAFASISNTVTLPSFTRVDAALFFTLNENVEAQLNLENVFDERYWPTAHNDNNITPGSPRAFRAALTTRF